MADLFPLEDLASYLQQDLDEATAERARRNASGWLRSATGLSDWPDPVPDDLWAWAVELAALAYDNPAGWATGTVDDVTTGYSYRRRAEILDAARDRYGPPGGLAGSGGPSGCFPVAECWPDPPRVTAPAVYFTA